MQSFSIIAWRPGASCGETTLAPIADSASLSEKNSWASDSAAHHDHDRDQAGARREQHADEDHVQQAEQEQRQEHPGLKPWVSGERLLSALPYPED